MRKLDIKHGIIRRNKMANWNAILMYTFILIMGYCFGGITGLGYAASGSLVLLLTSMFIK